MKILIFTEGTILMHKKAEGHPREEIVKQVKDQNPSVQDYDSYIPIGNAVQTVERWVSEGHDIRYITSRTKQDEVDAIGTVLNEYQFPHTQNLVFRKDSESYADVIERVMPDVLIEDNCESIGNDEIIYPSLHQAVQRCLQSIIVKEFEGIDHINIDTAQQEVEKA